jgi:hypothetical protein
MTSLTAAEYRALNAPKTANTAPSRNAAPTSKEKTHPKEETPGKSKEIEEEATPPVKAAAHHYVGPYQLTVANGTHYPGRVRCVIVGPASESLTAALVAALHQFTSKS